MESVAQPSAQIMRELFWLLGIGTFLGSACAQRSIQTPSPKPTNYSTGSSTEKVWPGRKPDGSVLLPNQWSLNPAGRQVELGDFPVNIAVHPAGRFAAVLHTG